MTLKEADRLHIMKLVEEKSLSLKKASYKLNLSLRQTLRIWKQYKIEGKEGLISKKRGKPAHNKIPNTLKKKIGQILHNKYADFGPTFAAEKLAVNENLHVSKESLRQIMVAEGLWIPKKKKIAKLYQRRNRRSCYGDLIQIDGSYHRWFEDRGEKCCLLVFIDDATSKIVEMRFCRHETTQDYLISLKRYLKREGKPKAFYSDKHSVFRVNRQGISDGRITHFGRVLKDLDIDLICANSPQAKGRVERANGILQDRLIKEMRLKDISSMEEGNIFLERYWEEYNKKFSKEALDKNNAHRLLSDIDDLEKIFSIHERRKLSKDLSFQYQGEIYQIKELTPSHRMKHAGITVIDNGFGKIDLEYEGKKLKYAKWNDQPSQGRIMDRKALNWEPRKNYKPNKNHPWR